MKLVMTLDFVAVDDVPDDWKDGRWLLAFGDDGYGFWSPAKNVFRTVRWRDYWEVCEVRVSADDDQGGDWEESIHFSPAFLADLPDNMEPCEVTE